MIYDDFQNQGCGFFGIQNGQFFNLSTTPGRGHGFFLKGFAVDQLNFWYELLGDEIPHHEVNIDSVLNVAQGQLSGEPEPIAWQIIGDGVGSE